MKILKVAFFAGVLGVCGMAFGAETKIGAKECYLPMLSCFDDKGGSECKKQQSVYDDFTKAIDSTINPLTYTSHVATENGEATESNEVIVKVLFKPETKEIDMGVAKRLTFNPYSELRDAIECKGQNCTKKAYNDDGKLQYEANCTNGINNGPQRFYDWNGKLELEINYSNGKPSGQIKSVGYNSYDKKETNIAEIKNGKLNGKIHIGMMLGGYEGGMSKGFVAEFKNGNLMLLKEEECVDACWGSDIKITSYNTDGTFNGVIHDGGDFQDTTTWIKNSKESKFKIPYEFTEGDNNDGGAYIEIKTWLEGGFNDKGEKHGEWKYTDREWNDKGEMIEKIKRHEVYENGVRTKILR